ncbi:MAG: carbohydrate binding domain-containing protein [Oligoflexales bacterium]|nr:carbohydrate binding domain-containing protein [Oligoflexales bacterium]
MLKAYFTYIYILGLALGCSQTKEILKVGEGSKSDKKEEQVSSNSDNVRRVSKPDQGQGDASTSGDSTDGSQDTSQTGGDGDTPEPVLGSVEFINPQLELTSEVATTEVTWSSVGSNLDQSNILYESRLCTEANCESSTCGTSLVSAETARTVNLIELTPVYVCLRSSNNDASLRSEWVTSQAINFFAGNLDISLENRVGIINLENAQNLVLGNLQLSRVLQSSYSFELVPADNGDHEYFNLTGPNNSTVSFNSEKEISREIESLSMTVKVNGLEEEVGNRSFIFTLEHPVINNNLITNGTFDNDGDGWTFRVDDFFTFVDDGGNKYLQVQVSQESERVHVTQVVPLEANTTYTLSVKMSGTYDGAPADPIVVDTLDQFDPEAQFTIRQDTDWTEYSGSFTTGASPVDVTIRLFQENNFRGTARYDDVSLIKNTN